MADTSQKRTTDQRIVRIAAPRGGVCQLPDLREAGITREQIQYRLSNGWMISCGRGIYSIPDLATERTPLELAMAVVPRGALSHATAAKLHGFGFPTRGLHLLVPKSTTNRVPGFTVHETRLWFDDDIDTIDGLRITSPARTICDLAAVLRPVQLRHLLETQLIARTPDTDDVVICHQRLQRRGRQGSGNLTEIIDDLVDDMPFAESALEQLLFAGLKDRGCSGLERQFRPPWYDGIRGIVDIADPVGKTIIEADGRRWHATTQAMDEDRRRDRLATKHGFATIRVGWRELKNRPATFEEIIELVESRRLRATGGETATGIAA